MHRLPFVFLRLSFREVDRVPLPFLFYSATFWTFPAPARPILRRHPRFPSIFFAMIHPFKTFHLLIDLYFPPLVVGDTYFLVSR